MAQAQDYTITSVEDTTFDADQYGNKFYSVQFEGWKGKVLWKTASRPENNTQVYGTISPSQSGKAMIFKKQKKEDWRENPQQGQITEVPQGATVVTPAQQKVYTSDDNRQDAIRWGLSLKEANAYVTKNRQDLSAGDWANEVNEYANALYNVADKPKLSQDTEALKEFFGGEEIPL